MKAFRLFQYIFIPILVFTFSVSISISQPALLHPSSNGDCNPKDSVKFVWRNINDPELINFNITVADNINMEGAFYFHLTTNLDTSITLSLPTYLKKFYWRIAAIISSEPSKWKLSVIDSFITLRQPVNLIYPANNNPCAPKNCTFKWETIIPGATYNLQVSTSNQFTSFLLNQSNISQDTLTFNLPGYTSTYYWRVSANYGTCTTEYSQVYTLRTQVPPPTLLSPADKSTSQSNAGIRFKWSLPTPASTYVLQIANDSSFSPTSIFYEGIKTTKTDSASNFEYNTTYYWRVNADNNGCPIPWSYPYFKFLTIYDTPGNVSAKSDSCSPSNIKFRWDAVTGATAYHLQISENQNFTPMVLDRANIKTTFDTYQVPKLNQKYYYRVKAEDTKNTGGWSLVNSFTSSDGFPVRLNPPNGAKNQPLTVLFAWTKPNPNSIERLQVATDNSFATVLSDIKNIDLDSQRVTLPSASKTYYWRMSTDANSCYAQWSEVWSFTAGFIPPVLTNPAKNAVNQSLNTTFEWQSTEGASSYEYVLATDMFFTQANIIKGSSGIISTKYPITNLLTHTSYYWKVRAVNAGGQSDWSEVFKFTTGAKSLDIPNLTEPPNGKNNLSNVKVVLGWDEVAEVKRYNLQFNDKNDFTKPLADIPDLPVNNHSVTSLKYNTTYYWRIKATNDSSQSDWSPTWSFKTAIQYPNDAALLSKPANNANDVTSNYTFEWQTVPRAENYDFQIASDMQFSASQMFIKDTAVPSNSRYVSGLQPQHTYFWRTRGKNTSGEGPWSETWNFTIIFSSVSEHDNTLFEINPNPAFDYIEILVPIGVQLAVPREIEIYDIMGERIQTTPSTSLPPLQTEGEFKIDVSGFMPGVYFVKIGDKVQRFVKI